MGSPGPGMPYGPGMDARPRRRALLLGSLGVAAAGAATAVETGLLPGRSTLFRALHLDGSDGRVPDVTPVPSTRGSFVSEARGGTRVGWQVAVPAGHDTLPVVVVLHGRGADHRSAFDGMLGLDRFLAVALDAGVPPFAVASMDGGNGYWHPRADGTDAGAMVSEEFLPLLTHRGLDTGRLGFLGWSMGGFGSLRLAGLLGAGKVRAVAAESPALFRSFAESAPGAFDDAADLADATVFGRQRSLDRIAVRIDCGEGDPFYDATRDYRDGFAVAPAGGFQLGGHTPGYWRRMAPAQLRFLGRALNQG